MVAPDPAIVTYPTIFVSAALLAMNSIWEQQWGRCAQALPATQALKVPTGTARGYSLKSLPDDPRRPDVPKSIFHIPFLVRLFPAPLAAGLKLPPDIKTETTTDSGVAHDSNRGAAGPRIFPTHAPCAYLAETLDIVHTGYVSERARRSD